MFYIHESVHSGNNANNLCGLWPLAWWVLRMQKAQNEGKACSRLWFRDLFNLIPYLSLSSPKSLHIVLHHLQFSYIIHKIYIPCQCKSTSKSNKMFFSWIKVNESWSTVSSFQNWSHGDSRRWKQWDPGILHNTRIDILRSIYNTHHNLHTEMNAGQIHTKCITRQMNGCIGLPASLFAHSISI